MLELLNPCNYIASRPSIYETNSYGCNACNGHRDKQQEHSHTQNVTFVTVLKETTRLVSLGFPGSISGQCGVKRGLKTTSIDH